MFFATTTVDVYRDRDTTDRDVFGDETETGAIPLYREVPVSLVEQRQRRGRPSDVSEEKVETFVVRADPRWSLREGDRLRDRTGGGWYQIQGASTSPSLSGFSTGRLVATRVGTV